MFLYVQDRSAASMEILCLHGQSIQQMTAIDFKIEHTSYLYFLSVRAWSTMSFSRDIFSSRRSSASFCSSSCCFPSASSFKRSTSLFSSCCFSCSSLSFFCFSRNLARSYMCAEDYQYERWKIRVRRTCIVNKHAFIVWPCTYIVLSFFYLFHPLLPFGRFESVTKLKYIVRENKPLEWASTNAITFIAARQSHSMLFTILTYAQLRLGGTRKGSSSTWEESRN